MNISFSDTVEIGGEFCDVRYFLQAQKVTCFRFQPLLYKLCPEQQCPVGELYRIARLQYLPEGDANVVQAGIFRQKQVHSFSTSYQV